MKVSIIIPVFNAAAFLEKCISSVLIQAETNEVILVDDNSNDQSLLLCHKIQQTDNRIIVLKNETGIKGAGVCRNIGIKMARSPFIAFLDADDYYVEGRFSEDKKIFSEKPEVDAVAGSIIIKTFDGKNHYYLNNILEQNKIIGFKPSFTKIKIEDTLNGNNFSIISITVRKEVLNKIGLFDESLKQCQDTDMVVRLTLFSNVFSSNTENPVAVYNIHSDNTTKKTEEGIFFRRKVAKKHFDLSIKHHLPKAVILKYMFDFIEYDFLSVFKAKPLFKKTIKVFFFPFFLYRLIFSSKI